MLNRITHNRYFRYVGRRMLQGPFVLLSKSFCTGHSETRPVGKTGSEHLFGYYDKTPWSSNQEYMCVLRIPFSDKHPTVETPASIELTDGSGNYLRDIGTTKTWNYQMGCRLQWLGPNFESQIIFNDFRHNRCVSIIKDIYNGQEKVLDIPVYDVAATGKYALSLDFLRLHVFRKGYGYDIGQHLSNYSELPSDDGIWLLDINRNLKRLIIPLRIIASLDPEYDIANMRSARFNHIMINPSNTRFMFLFRFVVKDKEVTRLYTASVDGTDICLFNTDSLVSHACWRNEIEFIVWCEIAGIGQNYFIFNDHQKDHIVILGEAFLIGDGHPSFSPNRSLLLTDTYSDLARRRSLLVYNCESEELRLVGKFYSPFIYSGSTRCDLHPRWRPDGSSICVDSAHEGTRQVYVIPYVFPQ